MTLGQTYGIDTASRFNDFFTLLVLNDSGVKWSSHNPARRREIGNHFSRLVFPIITIK